MPAPGRCATLSLTDNVFDTFGPDHHTLATVQWPEGREQLCSNRIAGRRASRLAPRRRPRPRADRRESSPIAFFRLGVEHILTGYDHILFLFALILRGGRLRSLLGIVTAFTVAHSITLALAVLGVVVVPSRIVEPVIALSIAYVALENIFRRRAASGRWVVSFVFGLVHGFGFAGALLELGLPPSGLIGSLVFFNLGVEAGQAMIVAAAVPGAVVDLPFRLGTPRGDCDVGRGVRRGDGAGDPTGAVLRGLMRRFGLDAGRGRVIGTPIRGTAAGRRAAFAHGVRLAVSTIQGRRATHRAMPAQRTWNCARMIMTDSGTPIGTHGMIIRTRQLSPDGEARIVVRRHRVAPRLVESTAKTPCKVIRSLASICPACLCARA